MAREVIVKEIHNQLDEELKAYNRLAIMASAANHNPRIKELLTRLSDLDPSVNMFFAPEVPKAIKSTTTTFKDTVHES
jgi:hypothetical protein